MMFRPASRPAKPSRTPYVSSPAASADRTTARIAAFIPGASPPLVSTAMRRMRTRLVATPVTDTAQLPDGPPDYPVELTEHAFLDDGTPVLFRAIHPDDADRLERLFYRLSPKTLYLRFFTPLSRINHTVVKHLVTVDYVDRLAIVAVISDEIVGVSRYERLAPLAPAGMQVDPGEAEALLESAGYEKDADGKFVKDGKPLMLTLTVPSKTPANASRARAIQAQLKKVGITVKLDTVPTDRYFDDYVVPLNFEMATFSWQGTPFPVASRQALFNPGTSVV